MMLLGVGVGLVALPFLLSVALCALMRLWAPRIGLIDRPGGRKAHRAPTPMGGGVAIWLTVVITLGMGTLVLGVTSSLLPPELAIHRGGLWEQSGELAW